MEAVERQTILTAEASQLDLGSVVQSLRVLLDGRDSQAIGTEAATVEAQWDGVAAQLAAEEAEERLAIMQAKHSAEMDCQQQQQRSLQRQSEHHAQCLEVEQQEGVARLELLAEQWSGMAVLAGRLPAVAGQLAEAQMAAQASRSHVESLQEALEERELAISRLGRELEAMQDAQASSDVAGQQRELGRLEAERREAILGEQRMVWSTLEEVQLSSHAVQMQQARMGPSVRVFFCRRCIWICSTIHFFPFIVCSA
jgi:chromosome segregation ATPase